MKQSATNGIVGWWWPQSWLRIIAGLWLDQRWYWQQIQPQFQDRIRGGIIFSQAVLATVLLAGAGLYWLGTLLRLASVPAVWGSMAAWSSTILLVLLVPGVTLGCARGTSMYGTCGLIAALLAGAGQAVVPWLIAHNARLLGYVSAGLTIVSLALASGIFFAVNGSTQRPRWLLQLAGIVMQVVTCGLFAALVIALKDRAAAGPFLELMWTMPAAHLCFVIGANAGILWAARQLPPDVSDRTPTASSSQEQR